MPAYAILLVGVLIVVGGVLWLRLHAFLALVLAAFAVASLTSQDTLTRYEAGQRQVRFRITEGSEEIQLPKQAAWDAAPETSFLILRSMPDGVLSLVGELPVEQYDAETKIARGRPRRDDGSPLVLQPDDKILHPRQWQAAQQAAEVTAGERIANAFGSTCASIGILIAMAAIIGKALLESGAADRIVRSTLQVSGERGAAAAFLISGFALGIPVFFDTVFYLMMPLGKAMRLRTGRNYLLYILTIIAGGTMAHSLVPPTPGPLLAASELGVDLATMIMGGCIVGLFTSSAGYVWAQWVNARYEVPLRESPEFSLKELERFSTDDTSQLPPFWLAILPIILPVLLIAGNSIFSVTDQQGGQTFRHWLAFWGNKNTALTLAAAVALGTLVWQRRSNFVELATSLQSALAGGGVIILITAAGGAFGKTIQQTGIAELLGQAEGSAIKILIIAFLVTAAIRTAQGSATVAMITAVGVLSGFATSGELGFHPVYLALAIGCGSKPILWMNDSGFWVVCKMSGMTEGETLRFVTPMHIVMALVGLIVCIVGATLLPMV
jgi:gluconate:H+ symporter, GntP family